MGLFELDREPFEYQWQGRLAGAALAISVGKMQYQESAYFARSSSSWAMARHEIGTEYGEHDT